MTEESALRCRHRNKKYKVIVSYIGGSANYYSMKQHWHVYWCSHICIDSDFSLTNIAPRKHVNKQHICFVLID